MRSLIPRGTRHRQRDPAPSRAAYRINRMMLTPGFRRFLRVGLPGLCLGAASALWLADETNRLELAAWGHDLWRQVEERPEFTVRLMVVEGASLPVADAIRAEVPLDFPLSSFDIDLADVQARIAALEAVASVDVQIRAGGELVATVNEREPVALWRDPSGLYLVDIEGHRVARIGARTDRADLPLLAGPGAEREVAEATRLLALAEPIRPRLRGLLRVGERRWDLVLDRGQRIMLPETDAAQALERVLALHAAQDLLERDIALVDMRNPDRPTVRVTPLGIEGLRRINDRTAGD